MINKKEILAAYKFLRLNNLSISNETLDFIRDASLKALTGNKKVWVVKSNNVCECDPYCNCVGYSIRGIYTNEAKALEVAKGGYSTNVDDYDLED